ncbi:phosphatidylinositol 4-phosphate 3-kinase C2 domain-containing subunit beta-like [Stylophora pistillata]|uniref:phosphatidylinositol 4-phosphate 3-kinase C2 domain-containing subunit beta-like n=1 Tax=Stylophora pistillata TaxID=50429 RepID=UPI000C04D346|nr:phosphatidylinositol 4-phosphate 3-kinase C2 domain-containing subunit beta-like [Stylophora pistillata]
MMEKQKGHLDDLMSFSSDEEDNVATRSDPSWLNVLSSEFERIGRSPPSADTARSLSPTFLISNGQQTSSLRNENNLSNRALHSTKPRARLTHSGHVSDEEHSHLFNFTTATANATGRGSLFEEANRLRASRSWDDLSPPGSPVKKTSKVAEFPHGGFPNYHTLFRPPSEVLNSQSQSSSALSGQAEVENAQSEHSYTSRPSVTLKGQGSDVGMASADQSFSCDTSSNSGNEHPYGSITLKRKLHLGESFRKSIKDKTSLEGKLVKDTVFFPSETTHNAHSLKTDARNIRRLTVNLPNENEVRGLRQSSKESSTRCKPVSSGRSPPFKIPNRPASASLPIKKSPGASRNSSGCESKFLFFGDGLFDVAKERNEEAVAFSAMMTSVRSNFRWDEETNAGHVLSPTIPYDHETFPNNTDAFIAIYTDQRQDTLKFTFSVHSRVCKIIELALSCLSNDSKSLEYNSSAVCVLKVCGRSEYLESNGVLIQYGYVQECIKFKREVELVLLESWQVSRQLARTEEDDLDGIVSHNYKEFFDCSVTTAVSRYGLTVLLEAFNQELVRLLEETTDYTKPRFEPSRTIQAVKAICATLATLETKELIDSIRILQNLQKAVEVSDRMVPNQLDLNDALSKLQSAVMLLIEMYCDAFDTEFVPTRIERPKLAGSIEVTAMTDNVRIQVAFAHRLPPRWNQDFESFEVHGGIYYGGRLTCPLEVTKQIKIARNFFDQLMWNEWLQFKLQVRQLPRESRVCFTLYGVPPISKGNTLNTSRTPLGWVALPLFDFKGVLVSGTHLLGLWPDDTGNPVGTCTSNLLHPSSVILQVEFERYLADIVFPDFESNGWLPSDETDRCEPQPQTAEVYKNILEKDLFNELKPEESELLWEHRHYCMSVPKALPLILSAAPSWEYGFLPEIYNLLASWAPLKPVDAMELLKVNFPDTRVRDTAVQWMEAVVDDELCDYLPQLVQALKYEIYHDSSLVRFLVRRALASVRVMHYLFWYLKDTISDSQFGQRFQIILGGLLNICGNAQRCEFTFQDEVVADLAEVARKVKTSRDSLRMNVLHQELAVVAANFGPTFRLPIGPSYEVKGVNVPACGYFTSNSAPLRLIFKSVDPFGEDIHAMFKAGDDMRQDRLIMQLVGIMNKIWLREGIDLKVITYQCVATGVGMGMVEIVKESVTLREIHTELGLTGSFKDEPIARWIKKYNTGDDSYHQAVENFIASCAGYCVATYVLGICDRHNDNIMIKKSGHMFHIDFAKILGNAQMFGTFRRDRAPFVLTPDMAFVINGGYQPSSRFQDFVDLCCKAFNVIRRHSNLLLNLLSLMLNSGISSLSQVEDLKYIRDSLLPDSSEGEATAAFTRLIEASLSSWFTQVNFFIHNVAQIRDVSQLRLSTATNASVSSVLSFVHGTYSVDSDGLVESARVVDFHKRYSPEKYYVYVVNICRVGDEEPAFVFRRFSHFHELHSKLLEAFPETSLPKLPSKIYIRRSQIRVVAERRRSDLDDYIRHLLMLPPEVSESELLYTFLHSLQQDKNDARLFSAPLLPEEKRNRQRVIGGQVKLQIRHERDALRVMIMHAKELSARNTTYLADPYVKLYLLPDPNKATKLKTKIARKTLNPTFNESLLYSLPEHEARRRHLQVTVLDHDYMGENEFLGGVIIDLSQAELKTSVAQWFTLTEIRKPP